MSVINDVLRKLEVERGQRVLQDTGGSYLFATRVASSATSKIARLWWMILGGCVVGGGVWIWSVSGGQWSWLVAAVSPAPAPAIVVSVPAVLPSLPTEPVEPALPAVTMPVPAEAQSVAAPVVTLPAPTDGRSVAGQVVTLPAAPAVLPWKAPVWVRHAGGLMSRGDRVGALQSWSQGLEKLSDKETLIVLPPSVSNTAAVALYRSLSGQFPVVLVPSNGTLRVLLVPDAGELSEVLADLRTQLKRRSLMATTVAAWRAELDDFKTAKPSVTVPVVMPVLPATVAMPARPVPALIGLESVSGAQGTASSSAAEILRRFTALERLLSQSQFDAALNAVVQLEAELGETWQTSYLKGTAAQGLRRWDEAIVALTRAHQQNPASMKVLLNRAICLQEMGKHEAAMDDLRQATALSPGTPELVANAAYSLDALGRPAEALVQYQKFLEMTAGRDEYAKLRAWASKRVAR